VSDALLGGIGEGKMKRIVLVLLLFMVALSGATRAHAKGTGEEPGWFNERFRLSGGGWFTFSDTDLGIRNNNTGDFVGFDLEDGLDVDEFVAAPWVRGELRFFKRNRILAEYSESSRLGNAVTAQDIDLGEGTIIPAGSDIKTKYKLGYIRTAYAFSFIKNDKFEVAVTAGVHFLDFSLVFEPRIGPEEGLSESADFSAPLPNVGMEGGWAINDRWALRGGFSWLQIDMGSVGGGIWSGGIGAEVHLFRHFDMGLRYQFLSLNADQTTNDVKTAIEAFSHGPALYGAVKF